jgi:hypothetical protein
MMPGGEAEAEAENREHNRDMVFGNQVSIERAFVVCLAAAFS